MKRLILIAILCLVNLQAFAGDAPLSWTAPTQNTDGSAPTDLAGYTIYGGPVQGGPYSDLRPPTTNPRPPTSGGVLAANLVQHGGVANRRTLETAAKYSYEQGLTPRLIALDEVFAESTMDQ